MIRAGGGRRADPRATIAPAGPRRATKAAAAGIKPGYTDPVDSHAFNLDETNRKMRRGDGAGRRSRRGAAKAAPE